MGNFRTLWQRAPWWRFCLLAALLFTVLTAFYPTPWLKKQLPWLPGQDHFTPPAPSARLEENRLEKNSQQDGQPEQLTFPDMQASFSDHIALAGHLLPLPQGQWHPVVQTKGNGPDSVTFIALARLDHSVVTGLLTAQFSQQALPPILADNLLTPCHDDRNYLSTIRNAPGQVNCAFLANALMADDVVSLNPFIHAAVTRIRDSGLLIPPLMISVGWRHLAPLPGGQVAGATVDILLAPMEKGTPRLLAPVEHWDKEVISRDPEASAFIKKAKEWMPLWSALLTEGYNNTLPPSTSRGGKYDPAAPTSD